MQNKPEILANMRAARAKLSSGIEKSLDKIDTIIEGADLHVFNIQYIRSRMPYIYSRARSAPLQVPAQHTANNCQLAEL